jgi:two-component system OmpR family response regulator
MTEHYTSQRGELPESDRAHIGPTTGQIMIIDDDPVMREAIGCYLTEHGFSPLTVSGRASVQRHLSMYEVCLILLDLRLQKDNGLDVLKEIRCRSDVPIIIATSGPANEVDSVLSFELGADDFLVKPFALREMLARIKAILRRQELARLGRGREPDRGGYQFQGWHLKRRERQLINPSGVQIHLTKGQLALLIAFLDAPQRPLTREYLLQATHIHQDIFDRSIDVQVSRLRRKLEANPSAPKMIVAQRGLGYVFSCKVERY